MIELGARILLFFFLHLNYHEMKLFFELEEYSSNRIKPLGIEID